MNAPAVPKRIPAVWLSWPSQCDLAALEEAFASGRELACGLLGYVTDRGDVWVAQIVPSPSGPQDPAATTFAVADFSRLESWAMLPTETEHRLVGNLHNHPDAVAARASSADMDGWRGASRLPSPSSRRGGDVFAGLIATASGDGLDWQDPVLTGWVAVGGELYSTSVLLEERWLHNLKSTVEFRKEPDA